MATATATKAKTVAEVCSKRIVSVDADDMLDRAAQIMRDEDVGMLAVVKTGQLAGALTDRDIVCRSIATGQDPRETRVADAMTSEVATVNDDSSVEDAAKLMRDHKLRRLFVQDADRNAVGVISLGDLGTDAQDAATTAMTGCCSG